MTLTLPLSRSQIESLENVVDNIDIAIDQAKESGDILRARDLHFQLRALCILLGKTEPEPTSLEVT